MTISMYKVSVPIFVQFLTGQSNCIDKAVAHIEAKHPDALCEIWQGKRLVARLSPERLRA